MQSKISFGIVLFGTKYLAESLPSLLQQDYENCEFYLLDQENGVWSAADFIKKNLPEIARDSRVKILRGENLWHSGGQNKLIRKALASDAKFYVAASNDIFYPKNLATEIVAEFSKAENSEFGSATIKLKKWENPPQPPFTKRGCESPTMQSSQSSPSRGILDSCGIGVSKSQKFFDIGQSEIDHGQFDDAREIFGASGAFAIFRRHALEAVANGEEFFDEKLHFKNDVDLAYRLNWLGWKCLFLPKIVAWHARNLGDSKTRNARSNFEKTNSTFGQFIVVAKNFDEKFSWKIKFATRFRLFLIRVFAFFNRAEKNGIRKFDEIRGKLQASPRKVPAREIEKMIY